MQGPGYRGARKSQKVTDSQDDDLFEDLRSSWLDVKVTGSRDDKGKPGFHLGSTHDKGEGVSLRSIRR